MGLFDAWNSIPSSITRGLSKAAATQMKTPFGHGISHFARQAASFTHKVTETFEDLDAATGGAASALLGGAADAAISLVPGAGAAIQIGKKAFSAGKMVAASLKRARAESRNLAALGDGDPFKRRKRSQR